ncbi:MAG: hypothetical protein U0670_19055 [Anaerolineae bacterium]
MKLRFLAVALGLLLLSLPVFAQNPPPTVSLGGNDQLGQFLVGPDGMTLYVFSNDTLNTSNCYERCAEVWPPLLVRNADSLVAGDGLPGELGTIERTTGTLQVTYNGMPLYFWYLDYAPGQTNGNRVGNVWWVVPPATVYASRNSTLGNILVGPNGNTVYMFTNDTAGVSNCADQCATNWPPLTVPSADAVVSGVNLPGTLSTITRADGSLQVTYNDMPLYYFANDAIRGDVNGEGAGDVWYTIIPATVSLNAAGDGLVATNGLTLYTSTNELSACDDTCRQSWTPYTTIAGVDRVQAGVGVAGELGTIMQDNGSQVVTYNGAPLYFSRSDRAPGDMNGVGSDAAWSLAAP